MRITSLTSLKSLPSSFSLALHSRTPTAGSRTGAPYAASSDSAALALAAAHGVDIEKRRKCDAPFVGVALVTTEVERKEAKARRKAERRKAKARARSLHHDELRRILKDSGVRNSFAGSTAKYLRQLLIRMLTGKAVPHQLLTAEALRKQREQYDAQLLEVTLEQPRTRACQRSVARLQAHGWLRTSLELGDGERRMIMLCHRVVSGARLSSGSPLWLTTRARPLMSSSSHLWRALAGSASIRGRGRLGQREARAGYDQAFGLATQETCNRSVTLRRTPRCTS